MLGHSHCLFSSFWRIKMLCFQKEKVGFGEAASDLLYAYFRMYIVLPRIACWKYCMNCTVQRYIGHSYGHDIPCLSNPQF